MYRPVQFRNPQRPDLQTLTAPPFKPSLMPQH